ncbi:sporulation transcriptional regulator SpoIIID, partial [Dysosmobacter welbionis]
CYQKTEITGEMSCPIEEDILTATKNITYLSNMFVTLNQNLFLFPSSCCSVPHALQRRTLYGIFPYICQPNQNNYRCIDH